MNEEILKLARDEALKIYGDPLMQFCDPEKKLIVAIYRAAYNKGVLRSAIMARNFWSNQLDQTEESAYDAIRALEMK